MANAALALVCAAGLLLLHLQQIPLLSGSLGEFWARHDANGQASKVFFALSLGSCVIVPFLPLIGVACVIAFGALHFGFSMEEWKR